VPSDNRNRQGLVPIYPRLHFSDMMRLKVPGVLWTDRQVDEYNEDFKNRYGYYWHEVFPHLDNDGNSNNNNNNNNNNYNNNNSNNNS
jgi:hypothetical protein